jgi:hypothetical protein
MGIGKDTDGVKHEKLPVNHKAPGK